MNRRDFLKYASLAPFATMIPSVLASNPSLAHNKKILLLVELKGGNDGLNTLIPFHQSLYSDLRPKLSIKAPKNMYLEKGFYMHPYLGGSSATNGLKYLWDKGDMAWIQGVGYPNANRSHFHSMDVWNTASTDQTDNVGWLSKNNVLPNKKNTLNGIIIGDSNNMGPFSGKNGHAVSMESAYTFVRQTKYFNKDQYRANSSALAHLLSVQNQINAASDLLKSRLAVGRHRAGSFPHGAFGRRLEQVSRLITSGVHLPVFKVTLDGFDTHGGQASIHNNLMHQLGEGLNAFSREMIAAKLWDNILVMTYSEFGRRVKENTSGGTDHGSASAHFVLGGGVNKGIYGKEPSLKHLSDGDLTPTVDFREMYASVVQNWWGRSNPWKGKHNPISFI